MTVRRWVWDPKLKELVPKESARQSSAPLIIPDIADFRLPGSDIVISGRKARREYLRANGLEEVGNDRKGLEEHASRHRKYIEERETKELKAKLTEVLRDREFFRGR